MTFESWRSRHGGRYLSGGTAGHRVTFIMAVMAPGWKRWHIVPWILTQRLVTGRMWCGGVGRLYLRISWHP